MNMGNSALEARVHAFIREKGLLREGQTVLAAVSGGADSMALLSLLLSLRAPLDIRVEAAHFEHGIRGDASREDARFVQAFCLLRGVPCHVGHGDVPALARREGLSLEDAARRARYAFLEETAGRAGADCIALGHHREDQAETLLLHLARGCALEGLAAMRPLEQGRVRPLLDTNRSELESYLRQRGIPWREDETNRDTAHARNLIRHEVFPALLRLNPRAAEAMCRTAELAGEAADALCAQAQAKLSGRVKRTPYGAFWLAKEDGADAFAVRAFARFAGVPELTARQTRTLCAARPGETVNLPGNWRALRTGERLHLLQEGFSSPALAESDFERLPAPPGALGDGVRLQAFDGEALLGASFRFRREGDVFSPLGSAGTQKLKQTLRDAGIDRPFRDLVPVLARENRVLWIVGLRPSRDAALTEGTQSAVLIRYHGDLPWEI